MKVSAVVSNSLRYPFRNIKKLPLLCILFVLMAITPIGMILDNRYVMILGGIAFFVFVLIVPGYLLSIVRFGSNESALFPSLSLGKNIYDSIRVFVLTIAYMLVPTIVLFVGLYTLGISSIDSLAKLDIISFFATLGLMFLVILITYLLFGVLLFFAKARLAYLNSLSEALKINRVITDIRNIGIVKIIKWLILMVILMIVFSWVSSFVMAIPYVGFLIYICIVIPILESIGNYSLGLLYSNIAENNSYNLDMFERELKLLKYK